MKSLDFIKNNINSRVYLLNEGDLYMSYDLRKFIKRLDNTPAPIFIRKLTRSGRVLLEDDEGNKFTVASKRIRLYSELKENL
jgi:hypothetical protein